MDCFVAPLLATTGEAEIVMPSSTRRPAGHRVLFVGQLHGVIVSSGCPAGQST
jgi:hypothetical protein